MSVEAQYPYIGAAALHLPALTVDVAARLAYDSGDSWVGCLTTTSSVPDVAGQLADLQLPDGRKRRVRVAAVLPRPEWRDVLVTVDSPPRPAREPASYTMLGL